MRPKFLVSKHISKSSRIFNRISFHNHTLSRAMPRIILLHNQWVMDLLKTWKSWKLVYKNQRSLKKRSIKLYRPNLTDLLVTNPNIWTTFLSTKNTKRARSACPVQGIRPVHKITLTNKTFTEWPREQRASKNWQVYINTWIKLVEMSKLGDGTWKSLEVDTIRTAALFKVLLAKLDLMGRWSQTSIKTWWLDILPTCQNKRNEWETM